VKKIAILHELQDHVLKCVRDQNGNHVVQKCIECIHPEELDSMIESFSGEVAKLSTHPYGCRVVQRVLEYCNHQQTVGVLDELFRKIEMLVQDQYGNYVIQHILEKGQDSDKQKIIQHVTGRVATLSCHKFASNVVEKCVVFTNAKLRSQLIAEVCQNNNDIFQMMKDQFANYVIQKMLDFSDHEERKILLSKMRPHIGALKKYTYGKHIITKLDKQLSRMANDCEQDLRDNYSNNSLKVRTELNLSLNGMGSHNNNSPISIRNGVNGSNGSTPIVGMNGHNMLNHHNIQQGQYSDYNQKPVYLAANDYHERADGE